MNIEYKDKLNIIQNSVYNIKNAIIEKGVQIAENEDITTFAEKISRISGGGGGETGAGGLITSQDAPKTYTKD